MAYFQAYSDYAGRLERPRINLEEETRIVNVKLTDLLLAELDREAVGTRKALERVPANMSWKPHSKSMSLGQLAGLTATMIGWIELIIKQDDLDLAPVDGPKYEDPQMNNSAELIRALDEAVAKAKSAIQSTDDEFLLNTRWQLKVAGKVVDDSPRYEAIRDSVINHLAHHRGQLTVYLRLNDASVPAIYGGSADEKGW